MKSKILFLPLLMLLLVNTSCQDDDQYCTSKDQNIQFEGEWEWVKSVGGIGGWTLTPESENESRRLKITSEVFQEFVNEELFFDSEYFLLPSNFGNEEFTDVHFLSGRSQYLLSFEQHQMILSDGHGDGFRHWYEKCK